MAQSRQTMPPKTTSTEEKIAHLMIKNIELKDDLAAREASAQLFRKQLDAIASIATDFINDQETETTLE